MDNAQFTTMQYDRKHLIIQTTNSRSVVIAECYLPNVAAQICKLLTDAAEKQSTLDNTQKGETNQ